MIDIALLCGAVGSLLLIGLAIGSDIDYARKNRNRDE